MFAPDETISKFDQITADSEGFFNHILFVWPESSTTFPYGTYTIEIISTEQDGISQRLDVKFTSTTEMVDVPVERHVNTLVFAPETATIDQPMRVFVQTTSDGLLIGGDPSKLLETTHVHLPSGKVETLTKAFSTLHQGLYFADYTPTEEGTYVFHVVAFSQGTISHGSVATTVLSQDIEGISDQIIELNFILRETSNELDTLKSEIEGFGSTLEGASTNIEKSTSSNLFVCGQHRGGLLAAELALLSYRCLYRNHRGASNSHSCKKKIVIINTKWEKQHNAQSGCIVLPTPSFILLCKFPCV